MFNKPNMYMVGMAVKMAKYSYWIDQICIRVYGRLYKSFHSWLVPGNDTITSLIVIDYKSISNPRTNKKICRSSIANTLPF